MTKKKGQKWNMEKRGGGVSRRINSPMPISKLFVTTSSTSQLPYTYLFMKILARFLFEESNTC